jgi:hypothetical protein
MPVVDFKVSISGIAELQKTVNAEVLNNKIATGLGGIANALHKELELGVHKRYTIQSSINSVLIGKGASVTQSGNLITATLTYEYKLLDLSEFLYSPTTIPYPPGYAAHEVTIIKGRTRSLHREGFGAFVPRSKTGVAWRDSKGRTKMFVRKSEKRLPLRALFGPSLSQMTSNVLNTNPTTGVANIVNNLDALLAVNLVL